LSKKDKDEYSKLKDEIKIYQYQDDTISFHSNLWYLNKKKSTNKNKFVNDGNAFPGVCKKVIFKYSIIMGEKYLFPKTKLIL
jgi:hypothetical protein